MDLREEVTGIIKSLETAWNKENLKETLDTMLEEGWLKKEDLPKEGDLMFLPSHLDLESGHTVQIKLPLTYHPEGATLVRPDDLIEVIILAAEALQKQDEYVLMSVQVNDDQQWEGVFVGEEGMESLDD